MVSVTFVCTPCPSDGFLCSPGRFFAANELKAMMAHIVLNYDIKFEKEGVRPPNQWLGTVVLPNPTAKVLFRKRHMQPGN